MSVFSLAQLASFTLFVVLNPLRNVRVLPARFGSLKNIPGMFSFRSHVQLHVFCHVLYQNMRLHNSLKGTY